MRQEVSWEKKAVKWLAVLLLLSFLISTVFIAPFLEVEVSTKTATAANTARNTAEANLEALRRASPIPTQVEVTQTDPKARADIAAAQEELADTKQKLANANQELNALRASVNDRTITTEGKQKLVEALKGSPKGTVIIKADWTDGEAQQFAKEIEDIMREAGFTLLKANTEVLTLNSKGVFVFVVDGATPPIHARPIIGALLTAGVSTKGVIAPPEMKQLRNYDIPTPRELGADEVVIWVARKP